MKIFRSKCLVLKLEHLPYARIISQNYEVSLQILFSGYPWEISMQTFDRICQDNNKKMNFDVV